MLTQSQSFSLNKPTLFAYAEFGGFIYNVDVVVVVVVIVVSSLKLALDVSILAHTSEASLEINRTIRLEYNLSNRSLEL